MSVRQCPVCGGEELVDCLTWNRLPVFVNVTAKDKATNKEQKITITNSSNLSEQDIDRMVKEAESNAESDKKKKEEAETKNNAESLIGAADRIVKDFEGKISDSDKTKLEEQKNY